MLALGHESLWGELSESPCQDLQIQKVTDAIGLREDSTLQSEFIQHS